MKRVLLLLMSALPALAAADHVPTSAFLGGWSISSGEEAYLGTIHNSYPLWRMVDGKPETAWVHSGLRSIPQDFGYSPPRNWIAFSRGQDPRLEAQREFTVDKIRIMNGYNKSPEIFKRNNRFRKLSIYDSEYYENDKPIATVRLPDQMGWHEFKIPKRKLAVLCLVFEDIVRGADNDLCVSEIELWNGKYRHVMNVPAAVAYNPGDECG